MFLSAFIAIYVSFCITFTIIIGKYLIDVDTNIKKVDKAIIFQALEYKLRKCRIL